MQSLELFAADILFRLDNLDWLGILDLLLVTIVFFIVLILLRRSRAALLLRGALAVVFILLMITFLLPLPTFDWLVRGTLILVLIATPIVLQPELRRFLEQIGRNIGLTRLGHQSAGETCMPRILRAVDSLQESKTGALIVLEGITPLQDIASTGIPLDSQLSSELLRTIFRDKTPLHDGAVILRGDRVIAASCLLPLTEQELISRRRLGMRHRAAVGMSEASDALIVVVSEETGVISVARDGRLDQNLDRAALRKYLVDYYANEATSTVFSFRAMMASRWRLPRSLFSWRGALSIILYFILAVIMSLTLWTFVTEQTNPTSQMVIRSIQLRVTDKPVEMNIMNELPSTVTASVRTTAETAINLGPGSFQATVSLNELDFGLHRVPVMVSTSAPLVQIESVNPPEVDVLLSPTVSKTLPISVNLIDGDGLSSAYVLSGRPLVSPMEATITGPDTLVEQVVTIQTSTIVGNATSSIRETRPLAGLDADGNEVAGVVLDPNEALVTVRIVRRQDARDVGVRAVITGEPLDGYYMSALSVSPDTVTIQGPPELLEQYSSFVDTVPVDITGAEGSLSLRVPLDMLAEITALESDGEPLSNVSVNVEVAPRTGDLLLRRSITIIGAGEGITLTVDPLEVELLLSGPVPTLNEIETNPDLVQVFVDYSQIDLLPGNSVAVEPTVVAPEGVRVQVIPSSILVTQEAPPPPVEETGAIPDHVAGVVWVTATS